MLSRASSAAATQVLLAWEDASDFTRWPDTIDAGTATQWEAATQCARLRCSRRGSSERHGHAYTGTPAKPVAGLLGAACRAQDAAKLQTALQKVHVLLHTPSAPAHLTLGRPRLARASNSLRWRTEVGCLICMYTAQTLANCSNLGTPGISHPGARQRPVLGELLICMSLCRHGCHVGVSVSNPNMWLCRMARDRRL